MAVPGLQSPQDDNGYDISDYQDIDPLFGTLEDMDELLAEAHRRGLKIVMDWWSTTRPTSMPGSRLPGQGRSACRLVLVASGQAGPRAGHSGSRAEPVGSYFGGSAWQYDPKRGEYYLHQFSRKQPDLNWENPEVRKAVYRMMNWWMDVASTASAWT